MRDVDLSGDRLKILSALALLLGTAVVLEFYRGDVFGLQGLDAGTGLAGQNDMVCGGGTPPCKGQAEFPTDCVNLAQSSGQVSASLL